MWSIGKVVNTVEISEDCAKDLFAAQGDERYIWSSLEEVTYQGKLSFNPDHMEHMDFLGCDEDRAMVEILKKHKVKGDICFGSLEGDNRGRFWGYRFDGKGGMKKLVGHLEFKEGIGGR